MIKSVYIDNNFILHCQDENDELIPRYYTHIKNKGSHILRQDNPKTKYYLYNHDLTQEITRDEFHKLYLLKK